MGQLIRRVYNSDACYLTFDDGPVNGWTEWTLDVLKSFDLRASFFLVANRAQDNFSLVKRMLNEGHKIGNHSLDHRYRHFFSNTKRIGQWIDQSETVLHGLVGSTIGFRPPNGIVTPPLCLALSKRQIPLILWNQRFFDGIRPLPRVSANRLRKVRAGDILLLHDVQKSGSRQVYQANLTHLLQSLLDLGQKPEALQP